jgi:hypothetical protein
MQFARSFTFIFAILASSQAAFAVEDRAAYFKKLLAEPIPVFVDCNLRASSQYGVSCTNVESTFFGRYGQYFSRARVARDAPLRVRITDVSMGGTFVKYTYEWISEKPFSVKDPAYSIELDPGILLTTAMQTELSVGMMKGAIVYLSVANAEIDEEGALKVTLDGGADAKAKKNFFTRLENSNFHTEGGASLNGGTAGRYQRNTSTTGYLDVNYSPDRYRFMGGFFINAQAITQPNDSGGSLKAKNTNSGAFALGARSFGEKRKWSVALYAEFHQNPGNNENREFSRGVALEYILVPYRTTQNQEIYARVGTGMQDLDLLLENDLGHRVHSYHFVFSEVGAYWTLFNSNFVLSARGRVKLNTAFQDYSIFSGNLGAQYKISKIVALNADYALSYHKKSLNFPKNPNYSNPLQTQFLTSAPGKNTTFSIGISVNIGNGERKSSDRRWKQY